MRQPQRKVCQHDRYNLSGRTTHRPRTIRYERTSPILISPRSQISDYRVPKLWLTMTILKLFRSNNENDSDQRDPPHVRPDGGRTGNGKVVTRPERLGPITQCEVQQNRVNNVLLCEETWRDCHLGDPPGRQSNAAGVGLRRQPNARTIPPTR